jgi:hypothetical protein
MFAASSWVSARGIPLAPARPSTTCSPRRVAEDHLGQSNLFQVCDNCHYATHILMWLLANGGIPAGAEGSRAGRHAALSYRQALAAGTAGKIPKEA